MVIEKLIDNRLKINLPMISHLDLTNSIQNKDIIDIIFITFDFIKLNPTN